VLLLNDDTEVVGSKWLTHLNEAAYSAGYIGCSGGKALFPSGELQEAGSLLFNNGYGANIGMMDDPFKQDYNSASYVGYVSGCMLYMRRDAIKEVGLLDEDYYPMYYEDSDWQYRAHIKKYKTVYEPKCIFVHHMGSNSKSEAVENLLEINRKKFVEKFKEYDIEIFNSWERTNHLPLFSRVKK
jgi:GT2 family glycosyltransferase